MHRPGSPPRSWASPTPPQPNTATVSSCCTPPVFTAAPKPAITPHPSRPAASGAPERVHLRALPRGDQRLRRERPDAERGQKRGPVAERHGLLGVVRVEAVPGLAALRARVALAAHGAPVEDDEVARRQPPGDVRADGVDRSGGLVTEQVREVVADAALAVGGGRCGRHRTPALETSASPGPGSGTTTVSMRHRLPPCPGAMTPRTSLAIPWTLAPPRRFGISKARVDAWIRSRDAGGRDGRRHRDGPGAGRPARGRGLLGRDVRRQRRRTSTRRQARAEKERPPARGSRRTCATSSDEAQVNRFRDEVRRAARHRPRQPAVQQRRHRRRRQLRQRRPRRVGPHVRRLLGRRLQRHAARSCRCSSRATTATSSTRAA